MWITKVWFARLWKEQIPKFYWLFYATSMFKYAGIEINLLWSVLKIDKIIYFMYAFILVFSRWIYCRKPSGRWRHEINCPGYLLLLITFYISNYSVIHFFHEQPTWDCWQLTTFRYITIFIAPILNINYRAL